MSKFNWLTRTNEERFMEKVELIPFHTCWEWIGAKHSKKGYGSFGYKNKVIKSHRVSYMLFVGSIPDNKHVLHRCDNPTCVNPRHLFLGTHKENMEDRNTKKRQAFLKGSLNGNCKLTENDVLKIRNKYLTQKTSYAKLANEFKVSKKLILNIIQKRAWSHV